MKTNNVNYAIYLLILAAAALLLVACGGQGGGGGGNVTDQAYVVFAWNDLGMHCLNPTYDTAVILPPYNTIWAQVVKRGNLPQVVTSGITVEYRILDNTTSSNKRSYGQFWIYCLALFGISLQPDTGLNLDDPTVHNGLSGTMLNEGYHYQVSGIPLTPVDDSLVWNPYQVAVITVKDGTGTVIAQTRCTAPTSDEIHCDECHGTPGDIDSAFADILQKHDADPATGTNLSLPASQPVLCASCHSSPALGGGAPGAQNPPYLSTAIHGFHGDTGNVDPSPECYQCHPGQVTRCSRSVRHVEGNESNGNCIECHGSLANVASTVTSGGRIPWLNEPKCSSCHDAPSHTPSPIPEVDTGSTLYRNAAAPVHGGGSLSCSSCHSSPHAMVPSSQVTDNYQAIQYQGGSKTIGSCGTCHSDSRGILDIGEFAETHGGTGYEHRTNCHVCHTAVPTDQSKWPHEHQWTNSN
jgi:hypothetical protein